MNASAQLHLAIIPDGNRRWAKAKGMMPWNGHEKAVENFRTISDWCRLHPRIGVLTVWCFSTENWKRDPLEVRALMKLLEDFLKNERKELMEKKTRFVHSGRKDRIPQSLAKLIANMEEETKNNVDFTLHLAVDYGGKDEIIRAIKKMESHDATEEDLRSNLDHPELQDIDIILRSSGEYRTSNFFLWQSAYAEWIFSKKLFPDIGTEDLEAAILEFDERKRRFGS